MSREKEENSGSIKPKLKLTSENSIHDNKKHLESKVEESTDERLGGGETEVTKVQEVRRQRRDVEKHSETEKVKPAVGGEMKTIVQPQLNLTSSASSIRDDTSTSMSGKSYNGSARDVEASAATTRETNMSQELKEIDKTPQTKSAEVVREAGGADVDPDDSSRSKDRKTEQQDIEDRDFDTFGEKRNETGSKILQETSKPEVRIKS